MSMKVGNNIDLMQEIALLNCRHGIGWLSEGMWTYTENNINIKSLVER